MANRGYDVVVDVDQEGDLGHTDLQEDLEFHSSNFDTQPTPRSGGNNNSKIQPDSASASFLPGPATASTSGGGNGGGGSSRKHYLWSLNFYAQAFDVDTNEVLRRCTSTLYPRANFLDVLEGNPDLYGPVWIATTVIVILFLTGTINQYLARKGEEHFAYDFKLLSGAAGLVYGYTAFVPVGLWGVLKWYGSESANLLECCCLYGYANLVWIAVSLVAWSPWWIVNYTVVALGLAASAFFLLRNLYPVLSTTEAKTSKILLIVVLVLHAGFAIAIKVLFFAATSPVGPKTGDKGAGTGGDEAKGSMLRMLLR
ncbi:Yip1 domain containing family [Pyrenophora tritici-repentis]|uniref:Protein YIP n=2 Tax=Pyrenophora tritici-repentis TaxID=45151 RepID=A0A2W1DDN1_9PLEO|nr:Yip1 domain containing family [Pyrenophora tritici-repentis Pt-1C-BFP]KAF7569847.1 Yip1 domain containing family [Pyrenophora tritici-repentis]EDU48113.1 Yip1 domain containing family [Pyrenophora tritici-repentis Pt-1C-BFP]KAI0571608.1 Protein YIP [Pyrenophora tritici-repentis]KAI0574130.1 Protein YIP [Pyrenophora tritici-repentis]KAI0606161.1 Protein YIP [Pyrenophora tritici-repentis]